MHQPFYKNLYTGEYLLPWVLLHGTKDYYDMPFILKEFDGIRQNFNLVPSLILQLMDYEGLEVNDRYVTVLKRPAEELTDSEKIFILKNLFNANWDNMIRPFPRFYELLKKRGFYYPPEEIGRIKNRFTIDEFRDIQVFFFLSWIDPIFFDLYDDLKYLKSKQRGYTEEDKALLMAVQRDILKGIMPLYKGLSIEGRIELSTSPFYHPIIPLLIDNRIAREATPNIALPERPFVRPEDAKRQIEMARDFYKTIFGHSPRGMWPPEGSVSDDALKMYMESRIEWVATDEEILFKSLGIELKKDGYGYLQNPEVLYRPYIYETEAGHLYVIFRDKTLSDMISFHYSRYEPKDAAEDLIKRIKASGVSVKGKIKDPVIAIIMDGENAWEYYREDGREFFRYLYEGLLKEKGIVCETISDVIEQKRDFNKLSHIYPGSWIAHNFSIWIGHPEDNMSWSLLCETRDYLGTKDPEMKGKDAWDSIFIAEGSDWNWWYGDEHASEHDEVFDLLFRENLANVYRFQGDEPPEKLSIPIILHERLVRPAREPINFIHPVLDGRVTSYFEWMGSGYIPGKGHGVAMHDARSLLTGCYYGFNKESLYVRIDFDRSFIEEPVEETEDISFEIVLLTKRTFTVRYIVNKGTVETDLPVEAGYLDILEIKVPFEGLGVKPGDRIGLWASLRQKGMTIDKIPYRGYIELQVPSEQFEMEMWYV